MIGLLLLFFIVLPEIDVVQGAATFSCVCLVPSIFGTYLNTKKIIHIIENIFFFFIILIVQLNFFFIQ